MLDYGLFVTCLRLDAGDSYDKICVHKSFLLIEFHTFLINLVLIIHCVESLVEKEFILQFPKTWKFSLPAWHCVPFTTVYLQDYHIPLRVDVFRNCKQRISENNTAFAVYQNNILRIHIFPLRDITTEQTKRILNIQQNTEHQNPS